VKSTRDVICRARDLGAVKLFYAGKLGLPIVVDSERLVGFDTGAVTLYYERGEPGEPVFDFLVDNIAAAKMRLTAAGCEIIEENPAIPRVYLRDPFGLVFNIEEVESSG
jgi:catechol 2,3-dioxygenase-like lactoylglutathione lyase family enzyme